MPSNGQRARLGLPPKDYALAQGMMVQVLKSRGAFRMARVVEMPVGKARGPRAHDTILHARARAWHGSDKALDPRPRKERRLLIVAAEAAGRLKVVYDKPWSRLKHEGKV